MRVKLIPVIETGQYKMNSGGKTINNKIGVW